MIALAGARGKLAEASFFLELLRRLENNQPVTTDSLDNEATYTSRRPCFNACYSVLEHLERQGKRSLRSIGTRESKPCEAELKGDVAALCAQNPDLYATDHDAGSRGTYGLRHLTVHHEVVDGRHQEQTHGGLGTARLGTTRLGAATHSRRLYVDHPFSQARLWIVPRMTEHAQELEELVTHWENRIASLDTPSAATHLRT